MLKNLRRSLSSLKRDTGAALLMAIFCVTMLMVIATEVMYETNVELAVSAQSVNTVKAHYAATAAVEISLLRIFIYRKAASMVGDSPIRSMLDPIWQMPFTWPPAVPPATNSVDKDEIKQAVKASSMQGTYLATIEAESAKLDINDLGSPLKGIVDNTRARLMDIFQSKITNDEAFEKKYRSYDFKLLIGNLKDWVDEDKVTDDGAQESSKYQDMGDSSSTTATYPPNQSFKTLQEIHMVAGMTDELYDALIPNITIYGSMGININYAAKNILMSLDPVQFTEERVAKLMAARSDPNRGPFKDDKDFLAYTETLGIRDTWYKDDKGQPKVLLLFDSEYNFRVRATGQSGKVSRDITAIVYDFNRVKSRLKTLNDQMKPPVAPTPAVPGGALPAPTPAPTTAKKDTDTVPNERPNIVYWNET